MSALGGRPAMVTAAAGSIALVIGPMVKAHGVGYILPTIVLAGIIQIAFGLLGMARLMRFVPRSVMIGFVNSLGILIFCAQVPHVLNVPWIVYPLFVLTVAIVLLAPWLTTLIPAPLIAIGRCHRDCHVGASRRAACRQRRRDDRLCWHDAAPRAAQSRHAAHDLADRAQRRLCRTARDAINRKAGR
jgi:Sulfate permease family